MRSVPSILTTRHKRCTPVRSINFSHVFLAVLRSSLVLKRETAVVEPTTLNSDTSFLYFVKYAMPKHASYRSCGDECCVM